MDKLLQLQARITSHNPRLDEGGGEDLRRVDRMFEELKEYNSMCKGSLKQANRLWLQYK